MGDIVVYRWGQYSNSHGRLCNHNRVDGPAAIAFAVSIVRQKVLNRPMLEKLKRRIETKLFQRKATTSNGDLLQKAAVRLRALENERETIEANLARASSDSVFRVIEKALIRHQEKITESKQQLAELQMKSTSDEPDANVVEAVLAQLDQLESIATQEPTMQLASELFKRLNLRLFFSFHGVKKGKREIRKIDSGRVTFGDSPSPVPLYANAKEKTGLESPTEIAVPSSDETSLRNVKSG